MKTYTCPNCDKVLANRHNLSRHKKSCKSTPFRTIKPFRPFKALSPLEEPIYTSITKKIQGPDSSIKTPVPDILKPAKKGYEMNQAFVDTIVNGGMNDEQPVKKMKVLPAPSVIPERPIESIPQKIDSKNSTTIGTIAIVTVRTIGTF